MMWENIALGREREREFIDLLLMELAVARNDDGVAWVGAEGAKLKKINPLWSNKFEFAVGVRWEFFNSNGIFFFISTNYNCCLRLGMWTSKWRRVVGRTFFP
jgi:hypothetical protein